MIATRGPGDPKRGRPDGGKPAPRSPLQKGAIDRGRTRVSKPIPKYTSSAVLLLRCTRLQLDECVAGPGNDAAETGGALRTPRPCDRQVRRQVPEAPWSIAEWIVALRFDNPRVTVLVLLLG